MTSITIHHNPRCTRSRATLELPVSRRIDPVVVRYLDTPPDARQVRALLDD